MKKATHIFVRSQREGTAIVVMYRASNGMRIGSAQDSVVQFGEDPRGELGKMRSFIDHSFAVTFLRTLADRDWATTNGVDPADPDFTVKASAYAAEIDDRDDKSRIVLASNLAQAAVLRKQ